MPSDLYEVQLDPRAQKELGRLTPWQSRIVTELRALETDPLLGHPMQGGLLRGSRSLEFSLPGGSVYRAIYVVIASSRVCYVFKIGPHENIYKDAARRYQAWKKRQPR